MRYATLTETFHNPLVYEAHGLKHRLFDIAYDLSQPAERRGKAYKATSRASRRLMRRHHLAVDALNAQLVAAGMSYMCLAH